MVMMMVVVMDNHVNAMVIGMVMFKVVKRERHLLFMMVRFFAGDMPEAVQSVKMAPPAIKCHDLSHGDDCGDGDSNGNGDGDGT